MPLLSFWKSAREDVLKLTIEQVVSNAGDGNLRDNDPCSEEFREFLSVVPGERLFDYARHCLESSFNKSGLVLQDIVNELGRRLEFESKMGYIRGNAMPLDSRVSGTPMENRNLSLYHFLHGPG